MSPKLSSISLEKPLSQIPPLDTLANGEKCGLCPAAQVESDADDKPEWKTHLRRSFTLLAELSADFGFNKSVILFSDGSTGSPLSSFIRRVPSSSKPLKFGGSVIPFDSIPNRCQSCSSTARHILRAHRVRTQPPRPITAARQISQPKLRFLDALRGLAALYVMLHHTFFSVSVATRKGVEAFAEKLLHYGHQMVLVFIVLSGFCLAMPYANPRGPQTSATLFFLRRSIRIIPPYLAAMLLAYALTQTMLAAPTGSKWDSALPVTTQALIAHLFMVHDIWSDTANKISYPLWSISVEWRIYFLVPLFAWVCSQRGPWSAIWLGLALSCGFGLLLLCVQALGGAKVEFGATGASPHFIALCALGFAAGMSIMRGRQPHSVAASEHRLNLIPGWAVALAVAGFLLLGAAPDHPLAMYSSDLAFGLLIVSLLAWLSLRRANGLSRLLSHPTPVFLGAFSYSLYLTHAPISELCLRAVPANWLTSSAGRMLVTLLLLPAVSLLFAYAFFRAIEQPCHRWSRRAGLIDRARVGALQQHSGS